MGYKFTHPHTHYLSATESVSCSWSVQEKGEIMLHWMEHDVSILQNSDKES